MVLASRWHSTQVMTMEAAEESHLDVEFDQMLVEMRPHVLRLAHKSGSCQYHGLQFKYPILLIS